MPASTPEPQFPGVGGQVQYSEGIDVGYRYYDANDETPLFPFGYGLSYTTFFALSRPACTVGPGSDQLHCNGQGRPVTVSATVTNTGRVAGLGRRPAVPGRPGRRR